MGTIAILTIIGFGIIGLWIYLGEKEDRNKELLENIKRRDNEERKNNK